MLAFFRRITRLFVRKSTQVAQEPLNRVSLIILILVDIFVLINVFAGLDNIANWPLSPEETFPCYGAYQAYQNERERQDPFQVDTQTIAQVIADAQGWQPPSDDRHRIGSVNPLCIEHKRLKQAVPTPENIKRQDAIATLNTEIDTLKQRIATLQAQYDSTLLEKIAEQAPEQSINQSTAERTKADIESAKRQIQEKQQQVKQIQQELLATPVAIAYLDALGNQETYATLKRGYESAQFWYPNLQFLLQLLFLAPLIAIAYWWHSSAVNHHRGLQILLSWHLLLIFCIPLLIKVFSFLQFGNLVRWVIDLIVTLVGGLLFIASYLLILLIPLLGFGLIKFLQRFVFNPQIQAKKRIQKSRCIRCNARLRTPDPYCPHCGFEQYQECPHCHHRTYKFSHYCRACGQSLHSSEGQAQTS